MAIEREKYTMNAYLSKRLSHGVTLLQLRCKIEKEENYFVIESKMLGLVGAGETIYKAERHFSEELNYIFDRYNQLPEKKLSSRTKRIKDILNSIFVYSK